MINPTKRPSCAPSDVPPFCYLRPGMTAEQGATAAVKQMGITNYLDALVIFWMLRREIQKPATNHHRRQP